MAKQPEQSMPCWYIKIGETAHGPHSWKKLQQGVELGKLYRETPVRQGTTGSWMLAEEIAGLFEPKHPTRVDAQPDGRSLESDTFVPLVTEALEEKNERSVQLPLAASPPISSRPSGLSAASFVGIGFGIAVVLVVTVFLLLQSSPPQIDVSDHLPETSEAATPEQSSKDSPLNVKTGQASLDAADTPNPLTAAESRNFASSNPATTPNPTGDAEPTPSTTRKMIEAKVRHKAWQEFCKELLKQVRGCKEYEAEDGFGLLVDGFRFRVLFDLGLPSEPGTVEIAFPLAKDGMMLGMYLLNDSGLLNPTEAREIRNRMAGILAGESKSAEWQGGRFAASIALTDYPAGWFRLILREGQGHIGPASSVDTFSYYTLDELRRHSRYGDFNSLAIAMMRSPFVKPSQQLIEKRVNRLNYVLDLAGADGQAAADLLEQTRTYVQSKKLEASMAPCAVEYACLGVAAQRVLSRDRRLDPKLAAVASNIDANQMTAPRVLAKLLAMKFADTAVSELTSVKAHVIAHGGDGLRAFPRGSNIRRLADGYRNADESIQLVSQTVSSYQVSSVATVLAIMGLDVKSRHITQDSVTKFKRSYSHGAWQHFTFEFDLASQSMMEAGYIGVVRRVYAPAASYGLIRAISSTTRTTSSKKPTKRTNSRSRRKGRTTAKSSGGGLITRRAASQAIGLAMLNATFADYLNDRAFTAYIQRSASEPFHQYLLARGTSKTRVAAVAKQLLPNLAPRILARAHALARNGMFESCQQLQQLYGGPQVQMIRRLLQEAKTRSAQ